MRKTPLEIYALAVCFFTVACFVIFLGVSIWNVIAFASPEFALSSGVWQRYQSDESFREFLVSSHRCGLDKDTYVPPEGAALTQGRERSYTEEIRKSSRSALQDVVFALIVLLIGTVVFSVHWRIAAKARRSAL